MEALDGALGGRSLALHASLLVVLVVLVDNVLEVLDRHLLVIVDTFDVLNGVNRPLGASLALQIGLLRSIEVIYLSILFQCETAVGVLLNQGCLLSLVKFGLLLEVRRVETGRAWFRLQAATESAVGS